MISPINVVCPICRFALEVKHLNPIVNPLLQELERLQSTGKEIADEFWKQRIKLDRAMGILKSPKLMEQLAEAEHDRWARWHIHASKNWTHDNIERWNEQAQTDYGDLTESDKEKDRREVREYLTYIQEAIEEIIGQEPSSSSLRSE